MQFEVDPAGPDGTRVWQITIFDPAGYVGRLYWYLLYPIHRAVFGRMLSGLARDLDGSA